MADSWIETELARELRPVAAPEELWSRIHEQRRPLRVLPHPWRAWSIASVSLVILLIGVFWGLGKADNRSASQKMIRLPSPVRSSEDGHCLLCHAETHA